MVEKASEFPAIDWRFNALDSYVMNLDEFIKVTCDQTEVRLKARALKNNDPVEQSELESNIKYIGNVGRSEFSSTMCGSVLVSIYFAYEASLTDIFNCLSTNKKLISFKSYKDKHHKKIKAEHDEKINFLITANQYAKEILNIDLFGNNSHASFLEELRVLRNSYVHNGCLLDNLTDSTREKIVDGTYNNTFGCNDRCWFITPAGVSVFFKKTYGSFKHFQRQAFHITVT